MEGSSSLFMLQFQKERTPSQAVLYGLYLYFLGLSFRGVSYALDPFVKRTHTAVWKWVQRYDPHRIFDVRRVQASLVDETYMKVGPSGAWVWVAVEPVHRYILGVYLSRHQNILVAELFLKSLIKKYGRHMVYSDGGTWYPEACRTLGLEHRLHSDYSKSLMERANQYLKDRIEEFDDHYPCVKRECDRAHVRNWLNLFVDMHYARRRHMRFGELVRFLGH
ncbi:MAG: IS6 family transposase [Thaumarchaeota archaeon]|nr:IS6 family transposase [Nitrososphaerota archaeon]